MGMGWHWGRLTGEPFQTFLVASFFSLLFSSMQGLFAISLSFSFSAQLTFDRVCMMQSIQNS